MNTCNEPEVIRDISSLKNAEQLKQWQLKSAAILEADLRRRTTDQPEPEVVACAEMPGELYSRRAHCPGCAEHEDTLPRSNIGLAHEVKSEEAPVDNGHRLFVGAVGWSWGQQSILRPAHILRVGPIEMSVEAEHPVPHFE